MWQGRVVSIHIAAAAEAPTASVQQVRAVVGKGLEGDRYFSKSGTYSNRPGEGRDVTLIEIEALEALKNDYGIEIDPGESRRNIVTRGVPLNDLVGRDFKVGAVTLRGIRLCEPCAHLERLCREGVQRGLAHRGGLRTHVISGGTIKVGDSITELASGRAR